MHAVRQSCVRVRCWHSVYQTLARIASKRKRCAAFYKAFLRPDGSIEGSSQTGYALAFTMGLVPPGLRQKMSDGFLKEIARFDWHPATGFIGVPRLLPGLHEAGLDEAAFIPTANAVDFRTLPPGPCL